MHPSWTSLVRSAWSVRGRSVLDAQNDDEPLALVDLADDAVRAAVGGSHPGEFALEWPADSVRVLEQCSEHELDDGGGRPLRQATQLSLGGAGHPQPVRGPGFGHVAG